MRVTLPLLLRGEVVMQGPGGAALSQKDPQPPHQLFGLLIPEPHPCCRRCQSYLSHSEEEEEEESSSWSLQ